MAGSRFPPGPRGRFLFGSLGEFRRGFLGFIGQVTRGDGDVVSFRVGLKRLTLVNHPDLVEAVLVTQSRNFIKHYVTRLLRPTLGNGLLMSEGNFWLRQRRLMQPAFQKNRIASYGDVMVSFAQRTLDRWQDGQSLDMHREMMRLTLEIVAKALFDADVAGKAADVGRALEVGMDNFLSRWKRVSPTPARPPPPGNRRMRRAPRRLDEIIFGFIRERRQSGVERGDLLSILLNARDEDDGTRMTDRQLRDEAMTLFLAGH